jgi:alanyl-tRNA synthetase
VTTRLYYTEPARAAFDATVVGCETRDGRIEVVLDRTAFYPTSGGQPFDTGTINGVRVLDVEDRDDDVVHVVEQPLVMGAAATAKVDWARRFDHMQQHTGQHVLSAACDRLFDARTESFHLGTTAATIDLARELTPSQIQAAEDEANRVVWGDRPVTIRFVSAEEAAALPLRKDPARSGPLRLIEVADFDLSACGGTHVARTGEIGIIAISGWEKFRGGTRVEFLCGGRALSRFRDWRDILTAVTRQLSVTPPELGATIERWQSEQKTAQRTLRWVQEQLAAHEGRALIARGDRRSDRIVVVEALDGWDAAGLKALAAAAAAADTTAVVALFSHTSPALVVVARGAAAPIDASATLKALVAKFGGKGGGKPELAQGGGLNADASALVDAAREMLSHG